jgi:hypothetical protein
MYKRITTILLAVAGLSAGLASAQTANPTQSSIAAQDHVPLFRVTVIGRTTPAINYRPRSGETRIDFAGTPLMPEAKGNARIRGEKGCIEIDARFDKLQPRPDWSGASTYVVWADARRTRYEPRRIAD